MTQKNCTYLLMAIFSVSKPAMAADIDLSSWLSSSSCQDSAVSSLLLAAGMYGGLKNTADKFSLTRSNTMFNKVFFEQGQLAGRDITFSYKGSSGHLGFSAGYIRTAPEKTQEAGSVLLGLDTLNQGFFLNHGMAENPWYVTLNVSRSFQFSDNIAFGVGSKTMLFSPPFDDKGMDNRSLSMSLNIPVSYKGFLTVTPQIQWSRSFFNEDNQTTASALDIQAGAENPDTFYGGMSISFSY